MRLDDLLLENKLLTDEQLVEARSAALGTGRLDVAVVELGYATESDVLKLLGDSMGMDVVSVQDAEVADDVLKLEQHDGTLDLPPAAEKVEIAGIAVAIGDGCGFDDSVVPELGDQARGILERTAIMYGKQLHWRLPPPILFLHRLQQGRCQKPIT